MRILYGLFISLILLLVFIRSYRVNGDVFSPLCIFSLFQWLRYVPAFFYATTEFGYELNERNLLLTFIIEIIFVLSVLLGIKTVFHYKRKIRIAFHDNYPEQNTILISSLVAWTFFAIGIYQKLSVLFVNGGIRKTLQNLGQIYNGLATGNGYLQTLSALSTLAIVIMIYNFSIAKNKRYLFSFVCMSFICVGINLVLSKRSAALELVMVIAFAFNYFIRKIKLLDFFKPKIVMCIVILSVAVIILPILRNNSIAQEMSFKTVSDYLSLKSLLGEFSYLGRDTYIYNRFGFGSFWFGRNYLNLVSGMIPSSIYHLKPALDDGVYLCNWMHGYEINPNTPYIMVKIANSYPFSSQGCLYANFGIIGVIIGGLLIGSLYRSAYGYLQENRTVFSVLLYQLIVYQFEISTLSIIQTIVPLVLFYVTYSLTVKSSVRIKE